MQKKLIGLLVCMLMFPIVAGIVPSTNTSTESIGQVIVDRSYSHTILGEFGTNSTNVSCCYAHQALKNIYYTGWPPFYYVSLVCDKNINAYQRAINELDLTEYPTVFFDGGYTKVVGADNLSEYGASIVNCGNRVVSDLDLALDITWLGAVNPYPEDSATNVSVQSGISWTISEMEINISVTNNESSQYYGHLHVYVTDIYSTMWNDPFGNPYTFAFLDYAFNQNIGISAGSTWSGSKNWDGLDYNNGTYCFENITQDNTMVIASVFNPDTNYSDETTGFRAGVGTDPKIFDVYFGNITPPPKIVENISFMYFILEGALEFNTTYYWKVDVWDALGNIIEGEIWSFTTRDNNPPYAPSNPHPEDDTTNVPINVTLCWDGGDPNPGDIVFYDVYLGFTCPPHNLVSYHRTETCYEATELDLYKRYYWLIVAWDSQNASTEGPCWTFTTGINNPPGKLIIKGPTCGKVGIAYEYTFIVEDWEDDDVSFYIDWGDGNITDWTPFQPQGSPGYRENHTWSEKGTYRIKAKTKDVWGDESGWGYLEVTMPKNQQTGNMWYLRWLERFPILQKILDVLRLNN